MDLQWNINLDRRTAESAGGVLVFHPLADGNFWVAATAAKAGAATADLLTSASAAIAEALHGRRELLARLAAPALLP